MKKILLLAIFVIGILSSTTAQVNPHAIGLRGGAGNHGSGGEISYQHGLGEANRVEIGLGWRGNNGNGNNYSWTAITVVYHWDWNITDGFNWYVGPGAQIGVYSDKYNSNNNGASLGLGGQIGIEYDFNNLGAPLLLGFDTRPMLVFIGGNNAFGYGAAFSLRYTF